jgi:tetratricopeptide (TPR) repeat protein
VQVKAGQAIDGVEFRLARPVIEKLQLPEVPGVSHNVAPALRELPADPDPGAIKETTVAVYPGKLARGDLDVIRPASIQGKVTGPPDVPVDNIVMRMAATGRHTTPANEGNFYFYNLREGENIKPPLPKVVAPLPQTTPPANGKEARPMAPTQSSDAQAAAREHNLTGRQLTQAGNYRGAIAELSEAIRIAPDFALAYNARGYAWFLLRNHAAAIEDLTWAIRLNPNYANAYQTRGKAKQAAGDLSGAAADLRLAKELAH